MRDAQLQPLTLGGLLADLGDGRFVVPNFQRDVEWKAEDIHQLMRSIFSDFFIGTLFLWQGGREWLDLLECEPISGFKEPPAAAPDAKKEDVQAVADNSLIVLDGQQRLTAMYYAFFGHRDPTSSDSTLSREWFFIDISKFEGTKEDDAERSSAFSHRLGTQADAKWFAELTEYDPVLTNREDNDPFPYAETQGTSFPLRLLGTRYYTERWLQKFMDFWTSKARKHRNQAGRHELQSQKLFALAERTDSAATDRSTYQSPPNDLSYQALKQEAEEADSAVSQGEEKVDSLRAKSRGLRQELKDSSHTGRNVGTGQELNKVQNQIQRARQELQDLKKKAASARAAVTNARQKLDRLADNGQQDSDGMAGKESADGLLQQALKEEQSKLDHEERAREAEQNVRFGESFQGRVGTLKSQFTVPAFLLGAQDNPNVVSDMFSQLNRRGKRLQPADMVNAYVSLRSNKDEKFKLKQVAREFETRLSEQGLASGRAREDVLRIMLVEVHPNSDSRLQDDNYERLFPGRPTTVRGGESNILIKDGKDFERRYMEAQDAYEGGLLALRDESYYGKPLRDASGDFVPFWGILPVYCSLIALANGESAWQKRVRQWYWACVLTERYLTSQESPNAARGSIDYSQVSAWFEDDTEKPVAIRHLEDRFGLSLFPRDKLTKPLGTTTPGLMKGIRGLLCVLQPRDWLTGDQYRAEDVTEVEIVSPQWCREQGLPEALARSVFNEVLVNAKTTDAMDERSPRQYLEAIFGKRPVGETDEILQSHCISQAGYDLLMSEQFTKDEFEGFLREREAEFLRQVAQKLFEDLDLRLP